VNVAMVGLGSFEDVQKALVMAKEDLSEILSGTIAESGLKVQRALLIKT